MEEKGNADCFELKRGVERTAETGQGKGRPKRKKYRAKEVRRLGKRGGGGEARGGGVRGETGKHTERQRGRETDTESDIITDKQRHSDGCTVRCVSQLPVILKADGLHIFCCLLITVSKLCWPSSD